MVHEINLATFVIQLNTSAMCLTQLQLSEAHIMRGLQRPTSVVTLMTDTATAQHNTSLKCSSPGAL